MTGSPVDQIREHLLQRRDTLAQTVAAYGLHAVDSAHGGADDLLRLIREVDGAIERMDRGGFGRCCMCGEPFEEWELLDQPLRRYCLCELSDRQQAELENDLDLAWEIQASLLPDEVIRHGGWEVHYRYQPAGAVSGDYCDVVAWPASDWLYFLVGDVAGKGVAAAYLSAHLSAMVRATLEQPVEVGALVDRVNRYLAARSPVSRFVTLVCGRVAPSGQVEICNAGQCPPLVVGSEGVSRVDLAGLPLGVASEGGHETHRLSLQCGESLVLYTDGITEATDAAGRMYGADAFEASACTHRGTSPMRFAEHCLRDLRRFRRGKAASDDVTLMVLRRDEVLKCVGGYACVD